MLIKSQNYLFFMKSEYLNAEKVLFIFLYSFSFLLLFFFTLFVEILNLTVVLIVRMATVVNT